MGVEVGFWHLSFRHPCDRKVIVWNIHIAGLTSLSLSPVDHPVEGDIEQQLG